jgi:hypothetical protein
MKPTAFLSRFARTGFLSRDAVLRRAPDPTPAQQPLSLVRHATLRLANVRLQLRVTRGCVWITRDGCPKDIVLGAGEVFDQHPGAPVLVHGLEDAELWLAAARTDAQNH